MRRRCLTVDLALVAVGAVLLIVALAGCGGSGRGRASGPFAWLRPSSAPTGWHVARIHDGATLAYPPGWTPITTDPGTASVAVLGNGGGGCGRPTAPPPPGGRPRAPPGR